MNEIDRKSDLGYKNLRPEDFIPFACYFDDETILTKNGELLQTIKFQGIGAEKISQNLSSIREAIRESINKNLKSDNIAIWFHTIRARENINDPYEYKNPFSEKINQFWNDKNYWDDKYTNNLYITFVHNATSLKISSFENFIRSLSYARLTSFHNDYLSTSHAELSALVNNIVTDLEIYQPEKFKIYFLNDKPMSPHMSLFTNLTQFERKKIELPVADLSEVLGNCEYRLGNNQLQAKSEITNRFCSMISLKEYSETSSNALDPVLRLPVEMVITEVIYIIPQKEANKIFERQNYILSVSQDEDLAESKNLGVFFDKDTTELFCNRQIMISVIADDPEILDFYINAASTCLSKLGIVHVREDVMLAHSFWSQLPGNFHMLHRLYPDRLKYAGAFAFLHQQAIGAQYNKWGRAVSLLRTEKGTPFFFSFHPDGRESGHTGIFGTPSSGKETLVNFLLCQSTKFSPTILYVSGYFSSSVFATAMEGEVDYISAREFISQEEGQSLMQNSLINPLLVENTKEGREYVKNTLLILTNHYHIGLIEEEIKIIDLLIDHIFTLSNETRNISLLDKSFDFKQNEHAQKIYFRLEPFFEGNKYYGIFSATEPFNIVTNKINMLILQEFLSDFFAKYNLPKDPKLMFQYEKDLAYFSNLRSVLLLYLFFQLMNTKDKGPFIFIIDPFIEFTQHPYFNGAFSEIMDQITAANGILLVTINIWKEASSEEQAQVRKEFRAKLDTKIYLPSEALSVNLQDELGLDRNEFTKLKSILPHTRLFLAKQNDQLSVLELSLGGFPKLLELFSCDNEKILDLQKAEDKNLWWQKLFEELI
jgi:type IV secretion system protein VirB4